MIGIMIDDVPLFNKHKHGLSERYGAVTKLMRMHMLHELAIKAEWEAEYAVYAVFGANNQQLRETKFSPAQTVLNCMPAPGIDGVADQSASGHTLHTANHSILQSEGLRRKARIRSAALSAFALLDSRERLRVALNHRSHPPRCMLSPGMEVGYRKQQGQAHRLHDREAAPQGPPVVVAMEGARKVRLRDRGSLVRIAVENMRLATEEVVNNKVVRLRLDALGGDEAMAAAIF